MKLANRMLTFKVNDVSLTDGIPKLEGTALYFGIQTHRKGDCVTLINERFDPATTLLIKHFSWGSCAQVTEGPLVGHQSVKLERQLTMAISMHKGSDFHLGMVPAVRGAKALLGDAKERQFWNIQIGQMLEALYIGLQSDDWRLGTDWWCDPAVGQAWYYASDGSLRNGNRVVARGPAAIEAERSLLDKKTDAEKDADQAETPSQSKASLFSKTKSPGGTPGASPMAKNNFTDFEGFRLKPREDTTSAVSSNSASEPPSVPSVPQGPYLPPLKKGDILTVVLERGILAFMVNKRLVDGRIEGIKGKVRLAAQFEHEGDSIVILPQ
mmetsp:Transcript_42298/g.66249  ORF Transcript_42298/g.66249 Transcript_42298/m.66249 type:complete len:325 (+) Transcript_42298:103-1077(+)